VDPAWNGADNMIIFYNSLKMKMSVIFGVSQMILGIILSLFNAIHFGHTVDVFCEFIPQILFMLSLFGYLCFLIIYKWLQTSWDKSPPYLLNVMISMILKIYSFPDDQVLFSGQAHLQMALVAVAVICIPWMLCMKPYVLKSKHKHHMMGQQLVEDHEPPAQHASHGGGGHGHGHGDGEFDFGEIMVRQIIHSIEFVLGSISNTASYLRLWALSLAHSELSAVFWDQVLLRAFTAADNSVFVASFMVFISYSIWTAATVGVLLIMESLSAFLHALRLHWVEFQNKFYMGDGAKFMPFSYNKLNLDDM